MPTLYLGRAAWSPRYSQVITGYDPQGRFVRTPRLYSVPEEESTYTTADGERVVIVSWAPDGRSYGREKKK